MIIKFGARGEAVIEIQKKLKELGFKGKNGKVISTDGIFGESTEYAVIQFQKLRGCLSMEKLVIKLGMPLMDLILVNS